MIALGTNPQAALPPDLTGAADPAGAGRPSDAAKAFGDVLRQLMGHAPRGDSTNPAADDPDVSTLPTLGAVVPKGRHARPADGADEPGAGDDRKSDDDPSGVDAAPTPALAQIPVPPVVPSPAPVAAAETGEHPSDASRDARSAEVPQGPYPTLLPTGVAVGVGTGDRPVDGPGDLPASTPWPADNATDGLDEPMPGEATVALARSDVRPPAAAVVQLAAASTAATAPQAAANMISGAAGTQAPAAPPEGPAPPDTRSGDRLAATTESPAGATGKSDEVRTAALAMKAMADVAAQPTREAGGSATEGQSKGFGESKGEREPSRGPEHPAPISQIFWPVGDARVSSVPAAPSGTMTEAVATASSEPAPEFPRQIVQAIRFQALEGGGEAHVRLRPEYLGEVVVAVKVEHGAVTASLHADTAAVRQWVEGHEASLRQSLADHGLHLDRLIVSEEAPPANTDHGERRRQPPPQSRSQQEPRRPRRDAEDATFEVVA